MAPHPPTPRSRQQSAQDRPHVFQQWWPEPLGNAGWRFRRQRRRPASPARRRRSVGRWPRRSLRSVVQAQADRARCPTSTSSSRGIQAFIRSILGGGGGGGSGGPRSRFTGGRGLALIGIAVVALWLASGIYRVEPDEQGVVLRFGAFDRTTLPGLNYHLPWPIESALTPAVTRINRIEIGYRSASTAQSDNGSQGDARGAGRKPDADRRREHHRYRLRGVLEDQQRRRLPVQHPQPARSSSRRWRKARCAR